MPTNSVPRADGPPCRLTDTCLHELYEGLLPTHGLPQLELVLGVAAVDVVVVNQEGDDDGGRLRVVRVLGKMSCEILLSTGCPIWSDTGGGLGYLYM